ncbi:MAG: class I SAM-dependent methyltransferase [Gammaproteobacteria bacterium]|nr:class I SAM-dependent methyltransferase [Gammaproteobacteria bacterium]
MGYDPKFPRKYYDQLADDEWTRLTRNRRGELNYLVHIDVLRQHITSDMDVLEIGAGAGIFTKELAHMTQRLVVADLSDVQLELNRAHMRELGIEDLVDEYRVLDLVDLGEINDASFDAVVCIGGPLSYLLDQAKTGIQEILRVLKPGGIAIVGVMNLINTLIRFMGTLVPHRDEIGIDNLRWVLETGIQDVEHNPQSEHYCHMMTSEDLDALLADESIEILEKRATGILSLAAEEALTDVHKDDELWKLIVERELAWSKLPGALDLGSNIVYVVRKR